MNNSLSDIDPFYATCANISGSIERPQPSNPIYAKLPEAPRSASPVPHLTSLYHFDQVGEYGDRGYPGNCGGNLIKDLLLFFQPASVFDPMTGSGTCRDVCRELRIPCESQDIRQGFDACDPNGFFGEQRLYQPGSFDFVWLHPPYWRQKLYTANPGDLSRALTLDAFLGRYQLLIANCSTVLKPGGMLAILMGDYPDREAGFVPLSYHTKRIAFACGFRQRCTDIIRFSHGASSRKKVYSGKIIPTLHDVCMIFQRS